MRRLCADCAHTQIVTWKFCGSLPEEDHSSQRYHDNQSHRDIEDGSLGWDYIITLQQWRFRGSYHNTLIYWERDKPSVRLDMLKKSIWGWSPLNWTKCGHIFPNMEMTDVRYHRCLTSHETDTMGPSFIKLNPKTLNFFAFSIILKNIFNTSKTRSTLRRCELVNEQFELFTNIFQNSKKRQRSFAV